MSRLYICDRCGKKIGKYPMNIRMKRIFFNVERHFCWDCYNKIVRFAFDGRGHHMDEVEE